jgi:ankyrin repeat protein
MAATLAFMLLLGAVPLAAADAARLFDAIRRDDVSAVKSMLQAGADPNSRDASGSSALMHAALHAGPECMNVLLGAGADPALANPFGATALLWAAGDFDKVRLLVEKGANVNGAAKSGRTPLIVAAAYPGNLETVRLLLAKGADPKHVDLSGEGPLGGAASARDPALLALLLRHGASVAETGERGAFRSVSPLMRAAGANCAECVRVLLAHGAQVNAVSADVQVVKAGLQEIGRMTPLLIAAPWGNPDMVRALMAAGASLEARDARGFTPLLLAVTAESQNTGVVRMLLAKGARADVSAADGQTALSWAHKWGRQSAVSQLVSEHGGRPAAESAAAPASPRHASVPTARAAAERSLALFQNSNPIYFQKSGCAGCHHQLLSGMLAGAVRERGWRVDEKLAQAQLKTIIAITQPRRESFLQRVNVGGAPLTNTLFLLALEAERHPADALTDAMVHDIAGMQRPDGAWETFMTPRPPIQYSLFSETAYAVRALRHYVSPGRRAEIDRRIARARDWLLSSVARHNEERALQLLGLHWAGADAGRVRPLAKALLQSQRPDGGWAQRVGFESDAYATGQALYALSAAAGMPAHDPAFQRGVRYLLRTQYEDGSWHVRSRAVKFQPYFESGFPHAHDQWISAAGTAWAALALTRTSPPRASN